MPQPIPSESITARRVVHLGATGAVGTQALRALQGMPDIARISVLTRRKLDGALSTKVAQHIVDVVDPNSYQSLLAGHDSALCTLGVGQPTKVSADEFVRIDKDAVLDFAVACKAAGVAHFCLLSSVDADATSRTRYLRVKGELIDALIELDFAQLSIFQPSMILTPHNRYGALQGVLLTAWPWLHPLLQGGLKKYRGVEVATLGRAMAANLRNPAPGVQRLHWAQFAGLAASLD